MLGKALLKLFMFVCLLRCIFFLQDFSEIPWKFMHDNSNSQLNKLASGSHSQVESRCRPPSPRVWNKDVFPYIINTSSVNCVIDQLNNSSILYNGSAFTIKNGRYLLKVVDLGVPCCIREIFRDEENNGIILSRHCSSIRKPVTKIPKHKNFVAVECRDEWTKELVYAEPFQVIHKVKKKHFLHSPNKLNVLIIGMDSTSQLNFYRKMPLTDAFIRDHLDAVYLKGHNKVGERTASNIYPLLVGRSFQDFEENCIKPQERLNLSAKLDNCSLLWNDFSRAGYVTSYSDSAANWSPFDHYFPNPFRRQPTDYYLRPVYLYSQLLERYYVNKLMCIGPRLSFDVMVENVKMMIEVNPEHPFFHFIWMEIGYWDLNDLQAGDKILEDFMKYLKATGVLNNTAVFFTGDHGYRKSNYQYTRNGAIEVRMPIGVIMLPEWFQMSYPNFYGNLRRNSEIMTSHFDVHKTILQILHITHERENYFLKNINQSGTSLFSSISPDRTCLSAGIPLLHCFRCHPRLSINASVKRDVARYLIFALNNGTNASFLNSFASRTYLYGWKWDPRDVQRELCSRDENDVVLPGYYDGQLLLRLNEPCGLFLTSKYRTEIVHIEFAGKSSKTPYAFAEVIRYYNHMKREWMYHVSDEIVFYHFYDFFGVAQRTFQLVHLY